MPRATTNRHPRRTFSLGKLILVTLVMAVIATAASHMVRAVRPDKLSRAHFVLFTVAAPVLLVVVISIFAAATRHLKRPPTPAEPMDEEERRLVGGVQEDE